jgi:SAM-dependent methyltransferase
MMNDPSLVVSPAIEDALWAAIERVAGRGALARDILEAAITARSRRYTSERERLGEAPERGRHRADLAARAVFFSVCDAAKAQVPIFELASRAALPAGEPLRVLDLGAGCGAMSLGLLDALTRAGAAGAGRRPAEILAVDHDPDALAVAREALGAAPWRDLARLDVELADVSAFAWPSTSFHFIVAGALVNELEEGAAAALMTRALQALTPDGALVVIEPALRETSRALHRLRDVAIGGGAHVFAPCTREAAPCPVLDDPRDWCHEDRPIRLTPRARALADATGLREHGAKFSYLVLRRERRALVEVGDGRRALRVVSRPRKLKGLSECFVCGEAGRMRLRRLKRDRSAENRALDRVRRGDVLVVPEEIEASAQVRADDVLERVQPASSASRSSGRDPE